MHYNYCTLFDSYYLDKGIVLIQSLAKNAGNYTLYVFAFDDITFKVLNSLGYANVVVIPEKGLTDVYTDLLHLKEQRTKAEYCWTCTPYSIEFVLQNFACDNCTYIDTDMYFWSDPSVLVDEMMDEGKSVLITPHFFQKNLRSELLKRMCGRYCVEFNTFLRNDSGMEVLHWWKTKCTEECSVNGKADTYGDQKYLDQFQKRFACVHELENPGAGMAPWNLMKYEHTRIEDEKVWFHEKRQTKEYKLVFYHFQGCVINDTDADLGYHTWCGNNEDRELTGYIYTTYIKNILKARRLIAEYYSVKAQKANASVAGSKKVSVMQHSVKRAFYQHGFTILTIPMQRYRKKDYIKI